ncbi:hypothetical protein CQY20_28370 [Mycolicibacterium agri]|uniref:Uncharacterized protein n=1 Tax=Mycolicibacterium agri TaxID=36811 RepID=A0A2A7MQW6_MYCAG|nr:hypothetical protein [Mycolicibacterium agri]PEG33883.1 hypothetical protein CQY20_28370 [Mycolicibacterium agri]GFG50163.1 hypothetical protein MAGR_16040 [Mycolicibacterium agri]
MSANDELVSVFDSVNAGLYKQVKDESAPLVNQMSSMQFVHLLDEFENAFETELESLGDTESLRALTLQDLRQIAADCRE